MGGILRTATDTVKNSVTHTVQWALGELRGDLAPDAAPAPSTLETAMPEVDETGLTSEQVGQKVDEGRVNVVDETSSRSYKEIIRTNVFSLFNVIIFIAMVLILITGMSQWKNALFGLVIFLNAGMGIFTEVRSKLTLEKLKVLIDATFLVRRNGENVEVAQNELVEGDYLWLRAGEQIPADGKIVRQWGIELDESMVTGESQTIRKATGDAVLSGTNVLAGLALVELTNVGQNSYAAKLTAQARVFKRVHSDLQTGINKILKFMMILVVPLTILLIWSQIRTVGGFAAAFATDEWRTAVAHAVAGIVGMIPDGLILLTSMNFALAAMKLARKNTLISQLESVETLARVDSLNLDKTGTLTDGGIALSDFIAFRGIQQRHLKQVLFDVVNEESPNPTAQAILRAFAEEGISSAGVSERINFSSSRKWSAAKLSDGSVWCAGAPEILLAASEVAYPQVAEQVENAARHGYRVLLLVQVGDVAGDVAEESDIFAQLKDGHIPSNLTPAAIVLCMESVRADAKQTLEYFREQGVRIRVISGDNPQTVGTIARKVEMLGPDHEIRVMDARELPSDVDQLAEVLEDVDVLGRVLPEQKKQIVQALHRKGKVVAMTGDGVNDALAIKEADLGIAMGNAAPATKSVAEVILTDSKFSHLPDVVAEGRQVMGNMERVSGLFLTKTVYAAILAIGTVVAQIAYPWLPIHISFIGALTIGFPAFILALAPNKQLYRPGFLRRVVDFALPSGIVIGCYMIAISLGLPAIFGWDVENSDAQLSLLYSFSYIPLFVLAVCVLTQVCRPLLGWRGGLVVLIAGMGVAGAFIPLTARFFEIHIPTGQYLLPLFAVILVGVALWFIVVTIVQRIAKRLAAHHLIDEK